MKEFRPDNCPACGITWIGEEIPAESRTHHGITHFRRSVGIYDAQLDIRVAVACPDCKAVFDRWTGRRLETLPYARKKH